MRKAALFAILAVSLRGQVRFEDIRNGPGESWLTYSGDYAAHRFSPLTQITTANVSNLVPKWTYHVENARKLEATPLVYNGVMYITNTTRSTQSTRKRQEHLDVPRGVRGQASRKPGRGLTRRPRFLRYYGRAPGRAESQERSAALGSTIRIDGQRLIQFACAAGIKRSRDCRRLRRRRRYARIRGRAFRRNWRRVLAILDRSRARAARLRNLERFSA